MSVVFGPVPSRRLGRSLGINHIPPKACSYACIYCQVGQTSELTGERRSFFGTDAVVAEVKDRLARARQAEEPIEHLSFVPDGEPTLDSDLGEMIARLKAETDVPVAVITNGCLLWRGDVRRDLARADAVSVKVDAVDETTWRGVNRPTRSLSLPIVLDGMTTFADTYGGRLTTETMLVNGVNDGEEELEATARFIATLEPDAAYIAVPIRPPAEDWVHPASPESLALAHAVFSEHIEKVELLVEPEAEAFGSAGPITQEIVGICAVHPLTRDRAEELLERHDADPRRLDELVSDGLLEETHYQDQTFYVAAWQRRGVSR